jgi:hypothetical protein
MDPFWLEPRGGIGPFFLAIQTVPVECSVRNIFSSSTKISGFFSLHDDDALVWF